MLVQHGRDYETRKHIQASFNLSLSKLGYRGQQKSQAGTIEIWLMQILYTSQKFILQIQTGIELNACNSAVKASYSAFPLLDVSFSMASRTSLHHKHDQLVICDDSSGRHIRANKVRQAQSVRNPYLETM